MTFPSLHSLSLISCAVITGQYIRFAVRIVTALPGASVVLPAHQWISFVLGRLLETAIAKSDRLSVTESCSLVVTKVTVKDGGFYTCRQLESGKLKDTHVHLFVMISEYLHHITVMKFLFWLLLTLMISPSSPVTERQEADKVPLTCSVSTPGWCDQTLKWLYEDAYVDKYNNDMKISGSGCSVTVTFPSSFLKRHRLFKCEVTDIYSTAKQQFPFSRQSSGEITMSLQCLFWWTIMDGDGLTSCEK